MARLGISKPLILSFIEYTNYIHIVRSSMASRSVGFGVRSRKLSNVGQSLDGWQKIYYLELLRASEGTLSRCSRLHLQSLAPTNSYWARVVGYSPFSLYVNHKEGLCPSSGDINTLMMTYHSRFIDPRRDSRGISDIPQRRFTKITYENDRRCVGG
jgi:hypothetical protein